MTRDIETAPAGISCRGRFRHVQLRRVASMASSKPILRGSYAPASPAGSVANAADASAAVPNVMAARRFPSPYSHRYDRDSRTPVRASAYRPWNPAKRRAPAFRPADR